LSLISLVAYVLTKLAVGIFAGGVVFGVLLPELHLAPFNSFWIGSVLVVLLTGLYTVLGGMRAVAYTAALRTGLVGLGGALRSILAACPNLLPVCILRTPGMSALALAKTGRAPGLTSMVGADGRAVPAVAQAAFPLMVTQVLPAGGRGFVVAGLLGAVMSSLAGAFNASSTLFTIDFYQRLRPQATQHRLVGIGRWATVAMVLVSLLWIPVIQGSKGLYDYLQGVQGYLAPPIFAVFFLGVAFKRLNAKGCLAALIVGFVLGAFRLAVDTPVSLGLAGFAGGYAPGSFLWIVNSIYFQYYSLF